MNHHTTQQQQQSSPSSSSSSSSLLQTKHPQATVEMCLLCFDVLLLKLQRRNCGENGIDLMTGMPLYPGDAGNVRCPLFVTWDIWRHGRWELRGCIGSLQPVPLKQGVPKYALTSALQDRRFQSILPQEVSHLRAKVSLLVQYEPCAHVYDWTVGVHGIMIEWAEEIPDYETEKIIGFHAGTVSKSPHQQQLHHHHHRHTRRYSATYLPEVAAEQGWDTHQAVESLIRKAGYTGPVVEELLRRIKCTRYQSSKCAVDFHDYCHVRNQQQMNGMIEPHALRAYQVAVSQANNLSCTIM